MKLPIELPEGWATEPYDEHCIVLVAPQRAGYVTVNWVERSFAHGIGRPPRTVIGVDIYRGRGWQAQLFNAAVESLTKVLNG